MLSAKWALLTNIWLPLPSSRHRYPVRLPLSFLICVSYYCPVMTVHNRSDECWHCLCGLRLPASDLAKSLWLHMFCPPLLSLHSVCLDVYRLGSFSSWDNSAANGHCYVYVNRFPHNLRKLPPTSVPTRLNCTVMAVCYALVWTSLMCSGPP